MTLKKLIALLVAVAGAAVSQAAVDAGVYSLTVHDITGDVDVVTEGEAAYPVAITGYYLDARKVAGEISGVDFRSIFSTANDGVLTPYWQRRTADGLRDSGSCCTVETSETFSSTYRQILNGHNTGGSVKLLKLTAGETYLLQVWVNESDASAVDLTTTVTVGGVSSVAMKANTGAGLGQYALVRFVAFEPEVTVTVPRFNAMQLRKITRHDATMQVWTPVDESVTWNVTGANWQDRTASDELWSPGPGMVNAATFAGDATVAVDGTVYARRISAEKSTLTLTDGELVAQEVALTGFSMTPVKTTTDLVTEKVDHSVQLTLLPEGSFKVASLTGSGSIAGSGSVEVTVAENEKQVFGGSLRGALTFTKKGAGTLELQGPSFFSGSFAIDAGLVRFGVPDYASVAKFDFDCSKTGNWTFGETDESGNKIVKSMKTATGACSGGQLNYSKFNNYGVGVALVESGDYFDGKPYLRLVDGASFSYQNSKTARGRANAWIFVYQNKTPIGTSQMLLKEGNNGNNNGFYYIDSNGTWLSRRNGDNNDNMVFVDGVHTGQYTPGKKSVLLSYTGVSVNDNRFDILGNNFDGALAQAIGFESAPTIELANSITMEMMWKWNLTDKATYQPIPATADLSVASGATLDLGVMTGMTVKSVALADGATLAIDALPEDGVLFNLGEEVLGKTKLSATLVIGGKVASKYRLVMQSSTLKAEKIAGLAIIIK